MLNTILLIIGIVVFILLLGFIASPSFFWILLAVSIIFSRSTVFGINLVYIWWLLLLPIFLNKIYIGRTRQTTSQTYSLARVLTWSSILTLSVYSLFSILIKHDVNTTSLNELIGLLALISAMIYGLILSKNAFPHIPISRAKYTVITLVLIGAISVWIFRIDSNLEYVYYQSHISLLLSGATSNHVYDINYDNVADLNKAGGIFFLNGNEASMFYGVSGWFCLASGQSLISHRLQNTIFGIFLLATSIVTGSKTAVLLLCATIILSVLLVFARLLFTNKLSLIYFQCVIILFGAAASLIYSLFGDSFSAAVQTTFIPRQRLWSASIDLWRSSPLFGNGYSAWYSYWPAVSGLSSNNIESTFPQHSYFFKTLDALGVLGVLFLIIFLISVILLATYSAVTSFKSVACVFVVCGIYWCITHGLADNTPFWGGGNLLACWSILSLILVRRREDNMLGNPA